MDKISNLSGWKPVIPERLLQIDRLELTEYIPGDVDGLAVLTEKNRKSLPDLPKLEGKSNEGERMRERIYRKTVRSF